MTLLPLPTEQELDDYLAQLTWGNDPQERGMGAS